jgi:hypothetical protein
MSHEIAFEMFYGLEYRWNSILAVAGAFTSVFREPGRAMTPMTSKLVLTKPPTHASLAADNGWRTPLPIETYCDVRVLNFELNINNQ